MKKMKLSNKLFIALLASILGILLCQVVVSHQSIETQKKDKTEQPEK